MVRVTVGNSVCRLTGLKPAQEKEMRKALSYVEAGSHYGGFGPQRRYLIDKKGEFPTGLLYLVKSVLVKLQASAALAKTPMSITVEDQRKVPAPTEGLFQMDLGYQPYPEQEAAARACLKHERGIVVAPTGVGKSAIAALIINTLQVRTLIVVPSLELKRQLTAGLRLAFGKGKVGSLPDNKAIAVENVDALDPKKPLKGYDCVIVDEFHHSGAKTYRTLNKKAWNGVFYKFGLTATPFRSQDEERLLLESVLSQVIYRVEYKDAVAKGYIVPMEAYYYELPKREVRGHTWAAVYKEMVVDNDHRNRLIQNLLASLDHTRTSALCLVKEIAHGDNILEGRQDLSFANGQDELCAEMIKTFNDGSSVLVATTGVCGEGVDTKPCEYVIIAGLGKSKNAFMQQVGRGFRTYPSKESCKVILFKDPSHKWTKAHFAAQVAILAEEYGIVPTKLSLPD